MDNKQESLMFPTMIGATTGAVIYYIATWFMKSIQNDDLRLALPLGLAVISSFLVMFFYPQIKKHSTAIGIILITISIIGFTASQFLK